MDTTPLEDIVMLINGGGLLFYIRSDIPCKLLDLYTSQVETINLELTLNSKPWFISAVCKSPGKVNDQSFLSDMEFLVS